MAVESKTRRRYHCRSEGWHPMVRCDSEESFGGANHAPKVERIQLTRGTIEPSRWKRPWWFVCFCCCTLVLLLSLANFRDRKVMTACCELWWDLQGTRQLKKEEYSNSLSRKWSVWLFLERPFENSQRKLLTGLQSRSRYFHRIVFHLCTSLTSCRN